MTQQSAKGILRALSFAAERHRDQRRKGAGAPPFVNHVIEVADLLASVAGVTDIDTLVAAILHDTIEDTDTTGAEIEANFGRAVRGIVEEVSDDRTLHFQERKRLQVLNAPKLSRSAKLVRIADKISNVRAVGEAPPVGWAPERRADYLEWARQVVDGCRGVSPALEALFDEVAANADRLLASVRRG